MKIFLSSALLLIIAFFSLSQTAPTGSTGATGATGGTGTTISAITTLLNASQVPYPVKINFGVYPSTSDYITWTLPSVPVSGLECYWNGLRQYQNTDYFWSAGSAAITLTPTAQAIPGYWQKTAVVCDYQ